MITLSQPLRLLRFSFVPLLLSLSVIVTISLRFACLVCLCFCSLSLYEYIYISLSPRVVSVCLSVVLCASAFDVILAETALLRGPDSGWSSELTIVRFNSWNRVISGRDVENRPSSLACAIDSPRSWLPRPLSVLEFAGCYAGASEPSRKPAHPLPTAADNASRVCICLPS